MPAFNFNPKMGVTAEWHQDVGWTKAKGDAALNEFINYAKTWWRDLVVVVRTPVIDRDPGLPQALLDLPYDPDFRISHWHLHRPGQQYVQPDDDVEPE